MSTFQIYHLNTNTILTTLPNFTQNPFTISTNILNPNINSSFFSKTPFTIPNTNIHHIKKISNNLLKKYPHLQFFIIPTIINKKIHFALYPVDESEYHFFLLYFNHNYN